MLRLPALLLLVALGLPEAEGGAVSGLSSGRKGHELVLSGVLVDGSRVELPSDRKSPLVFEPGLHRLDFDLNFASNSEDEQVQLRYQLGGNHGQWLTTTNGMSLICQVRDGENRALSEVRFDMIGSSPGWNTELSDSEFTWRSEPYYIPKEGRALYLSIVSGSDDTTGVFAIQDLEVTHPGTTTPFLWSNSDFEIGEDLDSPGGTPHRWSRRGGDPGIAEIFQRSEKLAIALFDDSEEASGEWASLQAFDADIFADQPVIISWRGAYKVSGGTRHRASFLHVPPGEYTFRAVGVRLGEEPQANLVSLKIRIPRHFWERAWFLPLVVGGCVGLLAWALVGRARRRVRRRERELEFERKLEGDRTRIARDMHDDLGTRLSILSLDGAMALNDLERDPGNARRLLSAMKNSTREMVAAMDDLVWAVDPAHDDLDQFASHLTRMAEEVFRGSPIRYRFDIPARLPGYSLQSDMRHQLALAVKEALHNVLRHAGPCEVFLSLALVESKLQITIRDTGAGFDLGRPSTGNGLCNFKDRLEELGGSCSINSSPGEGTEVQFTCPLPNHPKSSS
ncbi:MAG: sensor histidine kinase [Verrucomicrobiaceae bacterium]